jgi:CRP/FNR family transcriptional regulator, cyclic AMP receptor protein
MLEKMVGVQRDILGSIPLFESVPAELLQKLERYLEPKGYAEGEVIFLEGDLGDSLYVIDSGAVAIALVSSDGRELELAKLSDGDVFGELALLDGARRSAQARALTATTLLRLDRADFLRALRWDPRIAEALVVMLAQRLRRDTEAAGEAAFLDVPGRLARVLLRLCTDAPSGAPMTPPLSQVDLARMIGSTRESVNRCLSRYERLQLVRREGSRIAILDSDRLRRRAA